MVAQAVAAIALGLLGASGAAKLVDPDPTTGAMDAARLPASSLISRLLGVVEIVVASISIIVGGVMLWAGALLYAAFAVFTFEAVRKRLPVQSCGCFGRDDTPPTGVHVAYNVGAAAALFFVAGTGLPPFNWTLPMTEVGLYLGFAVIGVYASYLLLTRLPQTLELTRSP